MELTHILERISEGLVYVDKNSEINNSSRKGIKYLPGLTTIYEPQCADELMKWWVKSHQKNMKSRINSNIKPPDSFTVCKDIPTYCQGRIDSRSPSATPQR